MSAMSGIYIYVIYILYMCIYIYIYIRKNHPGQVGQFFVSVRSSEKWWLFNLFLLYCIYTADFGAFAAIHSGMQYRHLDYGSPMLQAPQRTKRRPKSRPYALSALFSFLKTRRNLFEAHIFIRVTFLFLVCIEHACLCHRTMWLDAHAPCMQHAWLLPYIQRKKMACMSVHRKRLEGEVVLLGSNWCALLLVLGSWSVHGSCMVLGSLSLTPPWSLCMQGFSMVFNVYPNSGSVRRILIF